MSSLLRQHARSVNIAKSFSNFAAQSGDLWKCSYIAKINNSENKYFKNINKNILELHIAHNDGNNFCSEDELKSLNDNGQDVVEENISLLKQLLGIKK